MSISFLRKKTQLLILGLDGSGKTTLMYQLKLGQVVSTVPTIGYNYDVVSYHNMVMHVWDVGGNERLRELWHHHYAKATGVIYVIDSTDIDRLDESLHQLELIIQVPKIATIPLLILANKQDSTNALSVEELTNRIKKANIHLTPKSKVLGISATTKDGVNEGIEWLHTTKAIKS